jgi:hypothetical protein
MQQQDTAPVTWAALCSRGRARSSAGGAGPEPKRPHVLLPLSVADSPSRQPRKPSPRSQPQRAARAAGPPRDDERYSVQGQSRRFERLGRSLPPSQK